MSTIYIIRHGQTDLNKKRVLQGRIDQPLNEQGIAQAKDTAEMLRELGISFDHVWSSPLQRAVDTARIVAGGNLEPRIDERLLEMDYGPYEGADLTSPSPELMAFFSDFVNADAPEGMEPLSDIVKRLGSLLEDLRRDAPEGNILLSTHAIAMKGALEYLTPDSGGSYWAHHIGNCEIYVTELKNGNYSVPVPLESASDQAQEQTSRAKDDEDDSHVGEDPLPHPSACHDQGDADGQS